MNIHEPHEGLSNKYLWKENGQVFFKQFQISEFLIFHNFEFEVTLETQNAQNDTRFSFLTCI
jgi:hypothetical protein